MTKKLKKKFIRPIKYIIFANDYTFFITAKNINISQQILQKILSSINKNKNKLYEFNLLPFYYQKRTKHIIF